MWMQHVAEAWGTCWKNTQRVSCSSKCSISVVLMWNCKILSLDPKTEGTLGRKISESFRTWNFLVFFWSFPSKNATQKFFSYLPSQNKNHNCLGKNKRRKLLLMKKPCLKSKMQQVYRIYRSVFYMNCYLLENCIFAVHFIRKKKRAQAQP